VILPVPGLLHCAQYQQAAVHSAFAALEKLRLPSPEAVGHRLVHGGADHSAPERVNRQLLDNLRQLVLYAPLHLPAAIQGIDRSSGFMLLLVRLWDVSPSRFASGLRNDAPRADCAPAPPRRALCGHAPSRGSKSDVSPDVL